MRLEYFFLCLPFDGSLQVIYVSSQRSGLLSRRPSSDSLFLESDMDSSIHSFQPKDVSGPAATTLDIVQIIIPNFVVSFTYIHFISRISLDKKKEYLWIILFAYIISFLLGPRYRAMFASGPRR